MELTSGTEQVIVSGNTTADVSGGLVADTLYHIYWKSTDPTMWHTELASEWDNSSSSGKILIATVTGAASTGRAQIMMVGTTAVNGQNAVNANQTVNQDSVTAAEVSNLGTTATLGRRFKLNTPGTDATGAGGGTDASNHWIRGFSINSNSDTAGRWLDIDGRNEYISIRDGATTDSLLTKMSGDGFAAYDGSANSYLTLLLGSGAGLTGGAGLRFFNKTATTATDATTISHFHAGGVRFYNSSGMHSDGVLTNIMMDIQDNNIRFHDASDNVIMRTSSDGVTFYDGSAVAVSAGTTLAELTSTKLEFYTSSGKADANRVLTIRANDTGGSVGNGLTLWGKAATPSGLIAGINFMENGISGAYSNLFLYNNGSYYATYLYANTSDIVLHSQEYVSLNSALGKGADIAGANTTAGLRFQHVNDTTNSKSYYCVFPISVMNGSHATLGTRQAAPWIHMGYYASTSTGWNHRPINAISSNYNYAGTDGTYSVPVFSFQSDTDTGMYRTGTDSIGFTAGGTLRATVSSSGIAASATVASDIEVNINSSTGLFTKVSSSRRYKDNIADLDINIENIYDLRPVSFDWKSNGKSDFGYIAEEVHEILPELTVYDDKNRPEAVKYKQLSILMLEELKKLREEVKNLKEKL